MSRGGGSTRPAFSFPVALLTPRSVGRKRRGGQSRVRSAAPAAFVGDHALTSRPAGAPILSSIAGWTGCVPCIENAMDTSHAARFGGMAIVIGARDGSVRLYAAARRNQAAPVALPCLFFARFVLSFGRPRSAWDLSRRPVAAVLGPTRRVVVVGIGLLDPRAWSVRLWKAGAPTAPQRHRDQTATS